MVEGGGGLGERNWVGMGFREEMGENLQMGAVDLGMKWEMESWDLREGRDLERNEVEWKEEVRAMDAIVTGLTALLL